MNEAEWLTRRERIDTRLRALKPKWENIPWHADLNTSALTCHAVTELPTANGPADYALFVNSVLLGIIEAKKVTVTRAFAGQLVPQDPTDEPAEKLLQHIRAAQTGEAQPRIRK